MGKIANRASGLALSLLLSLVLAASVTGCRLDMHDQPKYETLEQSDFFPDGRASRHFPEGTVAQGWLKEDRHLHAGMVDGRHATAFPFPVTREVLLRGQERYNIFCSPCHDPIGTGRGMIVQRGMKRPPSFHMPRMREAPPGHFFSVITNGSGAMFSYASRVPVNDRWAIVAYIRALQLSRNVTESSLNSTDLQRLQESNLDTTDIEQPEEHGQ